MHIVHLWPALGVLALLLGFTGMYLRRRGGRGSRLTAHRADAPKDNAGLKILQSDQTNGR